LERFRDLYIGAGGFRSLVALLANGVVPRDLIRMVTTVPRRVAGAGPEPLLGVRVPPLEVAAIARRPPSLLRSLSLELTLTSRAGVLLALEPRVGAEQLAAETTSLASSLPSDGHGLFSEVSCGARRIAKLSSTMTEEEAIEEDEARNRYAGRRRESDGFTG
jgi:hypothetical protein